MIYEKYKGNSVSIQIENIDEKDPYTVIGAKAFLSCKNVYEIKLPDTISEIGAWAFAHMKELKRVIVPARKISIGKDAFLDCENLKEIIIYPNDTSNQGLPYLLASCITILKANELLDFKMVAEQNEEWCRLYDKELIKYIYQTDDKNFQPVIVGWFNDEGEEEQLERYIQKVKIDKINLSFLRLKYESNTEDDVKEKLISYIKSQMEQSADGSNLGWEIIRDVLSDDIQYVKIAVANDILSEEHILELINYLNSINASTEIIAYLLSLSEENNDIDQQFEL